ncbi:MAG: hypothetical protein KAS48_03150, partial [Gammaproteobacteria bacterium]|nr:hypothetical protein [Gammaproteobacteria bacterium]
EQLPRSGVCQNCDPLFLLCGLSHTSFCKLSPTILVRSCNYVRRSRHPASHDISTSLYVIRVC